MNVQVVGCSHQTAPIAVRERLAFTPEQARCALDRWRQEYPKVEAVLLSTCNRVEFYTASTNGSAPSGRQVTEFMARFHGIEADSVAEHLSQRISEQAVHHLFTVASSLDSMVVGEPQILAQVKQAYQLATQLDATGPVTHAAFQAATKVARRVADETAVHRRRVSIPSVAVADFARQIFEHFDDKKTLVIGAGEMAEETLKYLQEEGAIDITVINRSMQRAVDLARRWHGRACAWGQLLEALSTADLVISTTGADRTVVTLDQYEQIEAARSERSLFILDLAVPRDFDPAIGDRPGVYLYSIDDLQQACQQNQRARDEALPLARRIIEHETSRFMAELHHRATGPIIQRLRQGWQGPKEEELRRLLNKLPGLDQRQQTEIERSFDRLVNKLLHPPLESLRDESRHGIPHALLDAMCKLFHLKD